MMGYLWLKLFAKNNKLEGKKVQSSPEAQGSELWRPRRQGSRCLEATWPPCLHGSINTMCWSCCPVTEKWNSSPVKICLRLQVCLCVSLSPQSGTGWEQDSLAQELGFRWHHSSTGSEGFPAARRNLPRPSGGQSLPPVIVDEDSI